MTCNGNSGEGEARISKNLGMVVVYGQVIKLVKLAGAYGPKGNDRVIGKVNDVLLQGWRLDINTAYSAVMGLKDATSEFIPRGADLTNYFKLGDYIVCKITNVTSQKLIDVTVKGPGLRKLKAGQIEKVNPCKVQRHGGKAVSSKN